MRASKLKSIFENALYTFIPKTETFEGAIDGNYIRIETSIAPEFEKHLFGVGNKHGAASTVFLYNKQSCGDGRDRPIDMMIGNFDAHKMRETIVELLKGNFSLRDVGFTEAADIYDVNSKPEELVL